MPVTIDDLFTPPDADAVMSAILIICEDTGLDITAWQSGQPGREELFTVAQTIANSMAVVGTLNKAGFLDYAASVTQEGGPGWLDILGVSEFGTAREPATYAAGKVTLTNTSATNYPFTVGALHVAASSTKATYTNTTAFTLAGNSSITVDVIADVAGAASTAAVGTINTMVVALVGVTVTNAAALVGADSERNADYVSRCKAKLQSLSPNGPTGAYDFWARSIPPPPGSGIAVQSGQLTVPSSPITRTQPVVDKTTGIVTTYVANASGPVTGYTDQEVLSILSSTNTTPITVKTASAHGYNTGDTIDIENHAVNTNANGVWEITVTGIDTFTIPATGNGVGGATGTTYRQSDLDLVDKSIQANAVPLTATAITLSATEQDVAVVGTLTVTGPTAAMTDAQINAAIGDKLATYAKTIPIGGLAGGTLYLEAVRQLCFNALPGTVDCTLSSPSSNTAITTGNVVVFNPAASFTVVRV